MPLPKPVPGATATAHPVHGGHSFADWPIKGWEVADLNDLRDTIHGGNVVAGWWKGERNVPEMLALIHSEVSEGLEGHRKGLMDDKLPHRPMLEVELADVLIRVLDLAGGMEFDIGGAVVEKIKFNRTRPDHKLEVRAAAGGKAY